MFTIGKIHKKYQHDHITATKINFVLMVFFQSLLVLISPFVELSPFHGTARLQRPVQEIIMTTQTQEVGQKLI